MHRLGAFPDRSLDVDVIFDLMIHDLDLLLAAVGSDVVAVEAVGVNVLTPKTDIANARLRFASGCIANLTASRISRDSAGSGRGVDHGGDSFLGVQRFRRPHQSRRNADRVQPRPAGRPPSGAPVRDAVLLTFLATELSPLQRVLGTVSLSGQQWLLCLGIGLTLLVVDEVVKFVLRRRGAAAAPGLPAVTALAAPAPEPA